jgi:hypothetical protein
MEGNLGSPRRPPKPKAPNGDEKKNQLDLFLDWAVETAKRATATAVAAKEAAARRFEELRAGFDRRSAKFCGILVTLLAACSYKQSYGLASLVVALAAILSALLTAVPLVVSGAPHLADRKLRTSSYAATFVLIIGVTAFVAEMMTSWLSSGKSPEPSSVPQVQVRPPTTAPEQSLADEAQKEAAARAEKETAREADCLLRENSAQAARRAFSRREKDFSRCRTEYANVLTLRSLDAYCGNERARLDAAGRALDATVANLCASTGSTRKSQ